MVSDSKHHAGIGLFLAGAIAGSLLTLGFGKEEGRRLAERLIVSLKELADKLNETEIPARDHFPPPPTV